jgi:sigma-B regulation protein RsbU (phosphoserine phosphatase)
LPCDANIPIGFLPTWEYSLQEAHIFPGTTIFLFTDGLTEAMDAEYKQFQMERVNEVAGRALANQEQEPHQLIALMTDAVHEFVGDAEQSDDLTMMAIQYIKQQSDVKMRKSIVLQNDLQELPRLTAFTDEVCKAVLGRSAMPLCSAKNASERSVEGPNQDIAEQIKAAVKEAVVNVMKYAYPSGQKGDLTVEAAANDTRLKFTIIDCGRPFGPTVHSLDDATHSAEEKAIGGQGIHIMRQNMDSINYERMDNLNVLTLRKKLTVQS